MTELEKNRKIDELMKKWEEEIKKIPDDDYGKHKNRLDNGNGGEYTRITKKYRKLINEIKNQ